MSDIEKAQRSSEIRALLKEFSATHLNDEMNGYVIKLLEKLERKITFSITRGKKEIWAASIIYAIARLNFLFDPENDLFFTTDTICDFFDCNKSTVGNKATRIEKACNLSMGAEGFCSPEISDSLTLAQLPNGMVVTKEMLKELESPEPVEIVYEMADPETIKEYNAFRAEQERLLELEDRKRIERRAEINRQIAAKKKRERNKKQLTLFDEE